MSSSDLSPLFPRLARALGHPVERLDFVKGGGYSPALRLHATLANGATAFVKVAVSELTAGWLRDEYRVYTQLQAPFMARLLGWDDDGAAPLLAIEDLSGAGWPPPWSPRRIELVRATLEEVASHTLPGLPAIEELGWLFGGWQSVAKAPAEFLALGLASPAWLERALPVLTAVDEIVAVHGDALMHCDVRSDNLCFAGERGERVVLVDWNIACIGSPLVDLAFWLPSLQLEGGPPPWEILSGAGALASLICGFFAWRAGQPIIPSAPRVREIQLKQLRICLPWVVRELGLPPLNIQ
jgi:hypothetical protein